MAGLPVLVFNLTYVALAVAIAVLERAMPHEQTWLENDGQIVPDIAHTLLSKGVAQVVVVHDRVHGARAVGGAV